MTNENSLSFRTGSFGRETLELSQVLLFHTDKPGIKLRICYPHRNQETGSLIERHTDTFLDDAKVEELRDLLDEPSEQQESIVCGNEGLDTILLEPHTIQEKDNIIPALKISIKVPGNGVKPFYTAITSFNRITRLTIADYLNNWLEENGFLEDAEVLSSVGG